MPIDIVLTTYNRLSFTKKVIEHLIERTTTPFRLIVVDNGSTDGTQDYINSLPSGVVKRFIPLPENAGLQRAKNFGLEYVTSEFYIDTDNDCLCPLSSPDWLHNLVALLNSHPDFAAISLRPQVLVGVGPIFKDAKEVVQNNVAGGSLRIMRTEVVKSVGGWDDIKESRREEWTICNKLRANNWKVGYTRDIFTYHMFGDVDDKKNLGYNNWGYPAGVEHYHSEASRGYAQDVEYDPITCTPVHKSNE